MDRKPAHDTGALLASLHATFDSAGLMTSRNGSCLTIQDDYGIVDILVVPPGRVSPEDTPLEAVVRVRTELAGATDPVDPVAWMELGRQAALASLRMHGGRPWAESRLTLRTEPEPWAHYEAFVQWAALLGGYAFVGKPTESAYAKRRWNGAEFAQAWSRLRHEFVCNADETGLTVEFSLRDGAGAAVLGDTSTALLRMGTQEPHPIVGQGLHVLLQLPHRFPDRRRLAGVVARLNAWELAGADRPPHFGSWCEGNVGNPAYTMFVPSVLQQEGLALRIAGWMVTRARLADGFLLSLGLPLDGHLREEGEARR